jgi:hypothetical protein
MLKKSASFVLVSLRDSTYRKGTPRLLAHCGRADGLFEHPAIVFPCCALIISPPKFLYTNIVFHNILDCLA